MIIQFNAVSPHRYINLQGKGHARLSKTYVFSQFIKYGTMDPSDNDD